MFITTPLVDVTLKEINALIEQTEHGYYPVSLNSFWHGGVHLQTGKSLCAVTEGKVVAYKFDSEYEKRDGHEYSSGFILTEHEHVTPKGQNIRYWCLYMHVKTPKIFSNEEKKQSLPYVPVKHSLIKKLTIRSGSVKTGTNSRGLLKGGQEVKFEGGLQSPTNSYARLLNGTYIKSDGSELEVSDEEPGFIYFKSKYVKSAQDLDLLSFDKVVEPEVGVNIKPGDILGFPGVYHTMSSGIHFEIFTESSDFLNNPKNDDSTSVATKVLPNAKMYSFSPIVGTVAKDIVVELNSEETNTGVLNGLYTKKYRPVKTPDGVEGVASKGSLDYQGMVDGKATYRIKEETELWSFVPPRPPKKLFVAETTTNVETEYIDVASAQQYIDTDGLLWYQVLYNEGKTQSWIASTDSKMSAEQVYNWPRWLLMEEGEESGLGSDAFCDVEKLLAWIDEDGDGTFQTAEIKKAIKDPYYGPKLRKIACRFPSEWDSASDETTQKWKRLKSAPWNFTESAYATLVEQIGALQWWGELKKVSLPDASSVTQVHPIGFLESLDQLDIDFDDEARQRIMGLVAKIESNNTFNAINADLEYEGTIPMSYSGVLHIGISWGFIQFTQDGGSLAQVLRAAYNKNSTHFVSIFGDNSIGLLDMLETSGSGMTVWQSVRKHVTGDKFSDFTKVKPYCLVEVSTILKGKDGAEDTVEKTDIWVSSNSGAKLRGKTIIGVTEEFMHTDITEIKLKEIRGPRVQPIAVNVGGSKEDLWKGVWKERFKTAGSDDLFIQAQKDIGDQQYLSPALRVCRELNLRSDKSITYAFDRCVNQGAGGGKKLMRAAAKKHGKPVGALGEYDYFMELKNTINAKLSSGSKSLAMSRYKKVLNEDELTVANFSGSTLTV